MSSSSSDLKLSTPKIPLLSLTQDYLAGRLTADEPFWRRLEIAASKELETIIPWIQSNYLNEKELKTDAFTHRHWIFLAKVFKQGMGCKPNEEKALDCVRKAQHPVFEFDRLASNKEKQVVGNIQPTDLKEDYVLRAFRKRHIKPLSEEIREYLSGEMKNDEAFFRRFLQWHERGTFGDWLWDNHLHLKKAVPHRLNVLKILFCNKISSYATSPPLAMDIFERFGQMEQLGFPGYSFSEAYFSHCHTENCSDTSWGTKLYLLKSHKIPAAAAILLNTFSNDPSKTKEEKLAWFDTAYEGGAFGLLTTYWKPMSPAQIISILEEEAMDGSVSHLLHLAEIYKQGLYSQPRHLEKAYQYYLTAAEADETGVTYSRLMSLALDQKNELDASLFFQKTMLLGGFDSRITPAILEEKSAANLLMFHNVLQHNTQYIEDNERKKFNTFVSNFPDETLRFSSLIDIRRISDILKNKSIGEQRMDARLELPTRDVDLTVRVAKRLRILYPLFHDPESVKNPYRPAVCICSYVENVPNAEDRTRVMDISNRLVERANLHPVAKIILAKQQLRLVQLYVAAYLALSDFITPDCSNLVFIYADVLINQYDSSYFENLKSVVDTVLGTNYHTARHSLLFSARTVDPLQSFEQSLKLGLS